MPCLEKTLFLVSFLFGMIARNVVGQTTYTSNNAASKIIDGTNSDQGRYPYMVALRQTKGRRYVVCAGTLIAPDIVLTAAHCSQLVPENVEVLVNPDNNNPTSVEPIPVIDQRIHPNYKSGSDWANDIMLLQLDRPVQNAVVVKLNTNPFEPIFGRTMHVLGWGTKTEGEWDPSSSSLQEQGELLPISNQECSDKYKDSGIPVLNGMLCVENDRSCQGDSGGPLIIKNNGNSQLDIQVGIISWAIGCGSKDYPGVHARISFHYDYIVKALCEMSRQSSAYFSCILEPTTSPTSLPTRSPSKQPSSFPTVSPSTSLPTLSPTQEPSVAPTTTPAPSNEVVDILIQIVTDNWANEIKWTLFRGREEIFERGFGYYTKRGTYKEVLTIERDFFYSLVVYDSISDGICCGQGTDGSISVYFGSEPDESKKLGFSDGQYTSSVEISFYASEITAPPTASYKPSSSPTAFGSCPEVPPNGCSVCPLGECVTNERAIFDFPGQQRVTCRALQQAGYDGIIGSACDILQTLDELEVCGCARPTEAPSPAPSESMTPSTSPTVSPAPSTVPTITPAPTDPLKMLVVLSLDQFPGETGWIMETINDENQTVTIVEEVEEGTYGNLEPFSLITKSLDLFSGERYRLKVTDKFGDGFCCSSSFGNGYAAVYFGTEQLREDRMVYMRGDFRRVDFRIFDPAPFIDRPAPAPVPGGPLTGLCFPGKATCEVLGKGQVPMKDLKLGDLVSIEGETYEKVYSFGHYSPYVQAEYLQLSTASRKLEISKDHMVFVEGGRSLPASSIKLGDKIETSSGEYNAVESIEKVVRQGAYAPFTTSGTIVVNGVKASSFVSFQGSETLLIGGVDSRLTYQFLAHSFEMPHRVWCSYFSSCSVEYYTEGGVSTWVSLPYHVAKW
eukprot:CAMPEP_0194211888 /NCGR_PEP_ID=MMETSP0156-20130528/11295_1 /TAXON_ID=33649 /ORGANISM="Thalassionema nitzschioides, Strain L26-B" /LENGTH=899 /DNA_ID=CAMNT_0038939575 /DNA_START=94 /DNA_END=2790 /DNA_ORIENTATION=+